VTGHYIDQTGRGYQTKRDEITSSKEAVEPNQEVVDNIARKLIHAYVFSLNPQLANGYAAKLSQHADGEVTDEEFKQSEQSVIQFLNQANENDFSPVDEITLVQSAKKLARIEDEKVREERIHALIDPLLEE
jgi:ribonucleotide monophosphatase NagD (HAD superfamily)